MDTQIKSTFDLLHDRLRSFTQDPIQENKQRSIDYNKTWNKALQCFQNKINTDRLREKRKLVSFIAVRQKLIGVKEIDDLRWLYVSCLRYSNTINKKTGKRNTFSCMFYGALK